MIQLKDATFGYRGHAVIHCASLDIQPGICVGIYGANGSGKSTLLRGIAGVLPPLRGQVNRGGSNIRQGQKAGFLNYFSGRRGSTISLVPQRQGIDPLWPMTALDAAALALSAQSHLGWLLGKLQRVKESLEQLRVTNLASRPFAELSGGQQQRVLLAGALACRPRLLLLDEPAEGLDAQSTHELMDLLRSLVVAGTSLVMISHEAGELARVADHFAWVEVASSPKQPNELALLSRNEFLARAMGQPATPVSGVL